MGKTSALTEETQPVGTDLVEISKDNGGGSYLSRKVQYSNLIPNAYGEIALVNGSTAQSLTGQPDPTQLTGFAENGVASLSTTPDHTDDSIEIANSGVYWVEFYASLKTGAAALVDLIAYWNTAAQKIRAQVKTPDATTVVHVSAGGLIDVTTDSLKLELWGQLDSDTSITLVQARLSCRWVDHT